MTFKWGASRGKNSDIEPATKTPLPAPRLRDILFSKNEDIVEIDSDLKDQNKPTNDSK